MHCGCNLQLWQLNHKAKQGLGGQKEGDSYDDVIEKAKRVGALGKKLAFLYNQTRTPFASYCSAPGFLIARTILKALRQASSSVLKVCLCCYALWLGCQPIPLDQSQEADCFRIPITSPRPNPLSSLWHLFLLPVSSSVPLFSSEVDNKDILRALLRCKTTLDVVTVWGFFVPQSCATFIFS